MNDDELLEKLCLNQAFPGFDHATERNWFQNWDRGQKDLLISLGVSVHQQGLDIFKAGNRSPDWRIGRKELGVLRGENVAIFKFRASGPVFRWHELVDGPEFRPLTNETIQIFMGGEHAAIQRANRLDDLNLFQGRPHQTYYPIDYIDHP